ncbi:MAG: hypothetical protein AVDCRST_MAG77-3638 [uncultured Chloroflexi bacterium]|uniref:Uncharacterized protein n=1 Tax=uncultured Chloroflexota bacterium TaxID=166587 RepID=A0A6J4JJ22_9CHLR|nr:MAG: hypothetical protein AVDCRST_MAG77-3638 [uncultured Chloroflexota bacterium]
MDDLLTVGAAGAPGVATVLWGADRGADSRNGFSTDPRSFGQHWVAVTVPASGPAAVAYARSTGGSLP